MNSRDRLLTALDGGEPDRIPRALSFYHVSIERLAPPGQHWHDMVDVHFVRFPPSPEENELGRQARPFPPDTRLGNWRRSSRPPAPSSPTCESCFTAMATSSRLSAT